MTNVDASVQSAIRLPQQSVESWKRFFNSKRPEKVSKYINWVFRDLMGFSTLNYLGGLLPRDVSFRGKWEQVCVLGNYWFLFISIKQKVKFEQSWLEKIDQGTEQQKQAEVEATDDADEITDARHFTVS